MAIWLTEADRAAYMEALHSTEPDPGIMPYLDELNAIPGVCTVTSCTGWHPHKGDTVFEMGYIRLHLSEGKARAIEDAANDLARFCNGYAASLMKEWEFVAHRVLHRGHCEPAVQYTVTFSGRIWMACLCGLIELLGEPCRR